jgi:hypothetical protein
MSHCILQQININAEIVINHFRLKDYWKFHVTLRMPENMIAKVVEVLSKANLLHFKNY